MLGAPVLDPPSLDKVQKERDNTKSHKDAFQKALLCAIRKCIFLPFLKSVISGNMRHYNAFFRDITPFVKIFSIIHGINYAVEIIGLMLCCF